MTRKAFGRSIDIALFFIWLPLMVMYGAYRYEQATFRNAEVELIASPYQESQVLQYFWRGDVYQSCPIVIDRKIITSEGVVITLQSSPLLPALPESELGPHEIRLEVETPSDLPEGPSIYQATERPHCNFLQRLHPPEIPYPAVHFTVEH